MADASDRRRSLDLRRDKMAQLGELTVGIAHELNNSIGYIGSNLGSENLSASRLRTYPMYPEKSSLTSENHMNFEW